MLYYTYTTLALQSPVQRSVCTGGIVKPSIVATAVAAAVSSTLFLDLASIFPLNINQFLADFPQFGGILNVDSMGEHVLNSETISVDERTIFR